MFKVLKSFSGKVSGSKGHVIELKDKAIISDLLKAGYIEEYSEKNRSQAELKKENESLKKENDELKLEIEELKAQLAEATKEPETDPEAPIDPEAGKDPEDTQKDK